METNQDSLTFNREFCCGTITSVGTESNKPSNADCDLVVVPPRKTVFIQNFVDGPKAYFV